GSRPKFTDLINVILDKRSLQSLRTWKEDFGTNLELAKVGYLFLARSEEEVANLEEATKTQNELGVNSSMITPEQVAKVNPFIDSKAILAGSLSPDDGYACPAAAVDGNMRAAVVVGVTDVDQTEVLDIGISGGAIESVTTQRGVIRTEQVICAAGAWSAKIGEMAGHTLPVVPVRRMIGLTTQMPQAHPTVPFTLDLSTTMYMHNYYNGM